MKKIFFILLIFYSINCHANSNQGILKDLTSINAKDLLTTRKAIAFRSVSDITFTNNYQATNRKEEYKDSYLNSRFFSDFEIANNLTISSFLMIDRIDNRSKIARRNQSNTGGGDRSFEENVGVVFRELNLNFNKEKYALLLGKFDLNFGNAWRFDKTGLWSYVAENYHEKEKLGASVIYRVGDLKKTGQYVFTFSSFMNDRKNLDNSLMAKRDSNSKHEGMPADSRNFNSYLIATDINFDFSDSEKLTYHFAYLNLAANKKRDNIPQGQNEDQKSFAIDMNYQYPINKNLALEYLIEYEETKNLYGNSNLSEKYLTGNLMLKLYKNFHLLASNTNLKRSEFNNRKYNQNLSEISFGYRFGKTFFYDQIDLQFGYKNDRTNFGYGVISNNAIGALLRYYKYF